MSCNCNCKESVVIKFAKENSDIKLPTKNIEDAGYDIYPNFEQDNFVIEPHTTRMIPTGLISVIPEGYYIQLFERGSTGTKGMAQRCGVIDSGYRGEWFVPITNTNNKAILITKEDADCLQDDFIVYPYTKAICQAVVLPVPSSTTVEISVEEALNSHSKRGDGKLGSSNK